MRSMNGTRMARPGCSILLNLPMRSTIQAVCCGTNRMIVLAGRDDFWKYDGGIPEPPRPIMPVFGAPFRGLLWKPRTVLAECWGREVLSPVVLLVADAELRPTAGIRLLWETSWDDVRPRISEGASAIFCADTSAMVTDVRESEGTLEAGKLQNL